MKYIIIGITAGTISGLGMGGGAVLILILTLWASVEQIAAQATNLVFFIPTALVATVINIKRKNIHMQTAIPIAIFGCIGAMLGAYIATHIQVALLKKLFGYFLCIIAISEIYGLYKMYKKEKK